MPKLRYPTSLLLSIGSACLAMAAVSVQAQNAPNADVPVQAETPVRPRLDTDGSENSTEKQRSNEELLKELDDIMASAEATRRFAGRQPKQGQSPAPTAVRLLPETLHLGKIYRDARHVRYVAMQLRLVNTTQDDMTIPLESIRLLTRGNTLKPNEVPPQRGLPHIPFGGQLVPLQELTADGPIVVPANGSINVPVAFFDLPGTNDVPEMTLSVPIADGKAELDLNDYARGLLQLSVEQLGPGGLLGLVTINGTLTPVGAGELADVLQQLSAEASTRVVLVWGDTAPPPPTELLNWLVQSAMRLGTTSANDRQHPTLSAKLVELHLAAVPKGVGVPNYPGPRRVHATPREAVAAALEGAFQSIPLDVLVEEIEHGHALTRPAAVAAGDRLPDDSLLLKLSGSDDPVIAAAAVKALHGHGSDEAIARLVLLAKSAPEPIRSAAVTSLAASRFGAAHEALRELLDASAQGTSVIPPAALIPVLSEHPRPLWGDALHRLALQGDPASRADALAALAQLGHPRLTDVFRAALASEDDLLRQRAFALAVWRGDDETQELALEVTLKHLETEPPTREMQLFLARTNDSRAVPLLLKHISEGGPHRSELVRVLIEIGGLEIREPLEEIYPKLDRESQRQVLPTLADLESPKFYEFAASALHSNEPALVSTATQQLQSDASPEAVKLLSKTLRESDQPAILSYVANGLAGIGTLDARRALREAEIEPGPRRDAARQAWWNLQRQSAGWEFFVSGVAAKQREDWEHAIELLTHAIEVDPQFVDAWESRASARMQLKDFPGARTDYERTLELDPHDAAAVTCLGILRVFAGEVEAGLAFVARRADEFKKNELFAYNTACLYAVASERIEKTDAPRAEGLRTDAVVQLQRSLDLGMTDPASIAWIRRDPDLKSLHDRDDFEKVVVEAEEKYGSEDEEGKSKREDRES